MLGRQICSTVLTFLVLSYNAWPYLQHVRQVDEKVKQSYRCTCDNRYCVRPLPELQPGSSIAVKLDNEGGWRQLPSLNSVTHCSYLVQTNRGVLRRNGCHSRPFLCEGWRGTLSVMESRTHLFLRLIHLLLHFQSLHYWLQYTCPPEADLWSHQTDIVCEVVRTWPASSGRIIHCSYVGDW